MASMLTELRRIKNTTRFGNVALSPAWDVIRALRRRTIQDDAGVLRSAARLSDKHKSALATAYAYRARAEIALDVACAYPGGDYFEFGSAGLCTFRSFLAAFDINSGHTKGFPDVKFWAFDIFGNPDQGSGPPVNERSFFEGWRGTQSSTIQNFCSRPMVHSRNAAFWCPATIRTHSTSHSNPSYAPSSGRSASPSWTAISTFPIGLYSTSCLT